MPVRGPQAAGEQGSRASVSCGAPTSCHLGRLLGTDVGHGEVGVTMAEGEDILRMPLPLLPVKRIL